MVLKVKRDMLKNVLLNFLIIFDDFDNF